MHKDVATVHIDGAARGNPGPAACAYVIDRPGAAAIEHAELLGHATNNVAEYTALVHALTSAQDLGLQRLQVNSDSELLVNQMNGVYKVKNPDLKELYDQARILVRHFDSVRVSHVRRELNRRADQLCNEALDGRPLGGGACRPKECAANSPRKGPGDLRKRVDDDAIACLKSSAQAWKCGAVAPSPEQVWEQLWSILEEAGVLKSKRPAAH